MGATEDCWACDLDEYGAPSGKTEGGRTCTVCRGAGWVTKPARPAEPSAIDG